LNEKITLVSWNVRFLQEVNRNRYLNDSQFQRTEILDFFKVQQSIQIDHKKEEKIASEVEILKEERKKTKSDVAVRDLVGANQSFFF
jgi:hypothetical protein